MAVKLGERKDAAFFFWLDIAYIAALALLALFWAKGLPGTHHTGLHAVFVKGVIGGLVPLAVPWFGALGGITISLYGVFEHNAHWQTRWNYWHAARPVVGAILASVGYLLFVAVIQSTGTTVTPGSGKPPTVITYDVLAFILGYREETFRTLIKRFVDLFLTPPPTPGDVAVAHITVDSPTGPAPHKVKLDPTGSSVPVGAEVSFRWDFDDGTPPKADAGMPVAVDHEYTAAGTYHPRLTLTTKAGVSSSATATVTVTSPAAPPADQAPKSGESTGAVVQ